MNEKNTAANVTQTGKPSDNNATNVSSRRKFLGQVGAALAGGAVLGKAAVASAQDYNRAVGDTNAASEWRGRSAGQHSPLPSASRRRPKKR